MAEHTYTYSKATDFGGAINSHTLETAIYASSIETALARIDTAGDVVEVVFKAQPSQADKTTLDGGASQTEESPPAADSLLDEHDGSVVTIPDQTLIVNEDETKWYQPQTSNKTPIVNPDTIPPGYMLYLTGAFDDLETGKRGVGAQIEKAVTNDAGPITEYVEGQFCEHAYIVGGEFGVQNDNFGDWVSMLAYAPASAPTNVPTGTGNANKGGVLAIDNKNGTFQAGDVLTGGTSGHTAAVAAVLADTELQVAHIGTGAFEDDEEVTGSISSATADVDGLIAGNMFVPAADNGFWNVDGSALTVGEINENLVPVPNPGTPQAGFWNWDPDVDPSITPAPSQDGSYDLYDIDIPLVRQANRISVLMHEKGCCPPNIRGKKLLPHWIFRFYVHREAAGPVSVAFVMKFGRRSTVNSTDLL